MKASKIFFLALRSKHGTEDTINAIDTTNVAKTNDAQWTFEHTLSFLELPLHLNQGFFFDILSLHPPSNNTLTGQPTFIANFLIRSLHH